MPNRKLISSVYPGLIGSADDSRLNPHVSASDCRAIVSVAGDSHILNHICQLAIKTTAEYVRANNLSIIDSERLTDYLRERSAPGLVTAESVARNDAGRDSGGGQQAKNAADGKSKSRSGVKGRGKG